MFRKPVSSIPFKRRTIRALTLFSNWPRKVYWKKKKNNGFPIHPGLIWLFVVGPNLTLFAVRPGNEAAPSLHLVGPVKENRVKQDQEGWSWVTAAWRLLAGDSTVLWVINSYVLLALSAGTLGLLMDRQRWAKSVCSCIDRLFKFIFLNRYFLFKDQGLIVKVLSWIEFMQAARLLW